MDRLIYFINKLWTFATTFQPLTYLIALIALGLLFFISKWAIRKFRPQTNKQNIVAAASTIFIGIPVLGLILVYIVELLLKDQPF